jgi:hypothetical protein
LFGQKYVINGAVRYFFQPKRTVKKILEMPGNGESSGASAWHRPRVASQEREIVAHLCSTLCRGFLLSTVHRK